MQQNKPPTSFSSLKGVQDKALSLFLHRDIEALKRLTQGLEQHPNKSTAEELSSLVYGYLFELEGNLDKALDSYQNLMGETFNPLIEEALRRISVICLSQKNLEMATLALECLSHTSLDYKVKYADLLCTLDRRQEAADLYTSYLENIPSDIEVLLKLGNNYRAMGEEKAAQQIFKLVLQQQPANKMARALLQNS